MSASRAGRNFPHYVGTQFSQDFGYWLIGVVPNSQSSTGPFSTCIHLRMADRGRERQGRWEEEGEREMERGRERERVGGEGREGGTR